MRFGLNPRRAATGAETAVLIWQIAALLPAPYMLFASGYRGLFMSRGPLAWLCDAGFSILPRAETLLLSLAYRRTESELVVFFAALIAALVWGVVSRRLLRGERTAVPVRWVLLALIGADIVLRLLPLPFNGAFGTAMAVLGLVVRLGSFVLVLLDLRAHRRGND